MTNVYGISSVIEVASSLCLCLAVVHSFSTKKIRHISRLLTREHTRFGSLQARIFYALSEVEIVFFLWAVIFSLIFFATDSDRAFVYLAGREYSEPAFVFVILAISSTKPILDVARSILLKVAGMLPLSKSLAFFIVTMTLGPLSGSFITEPAAMTVTALLLAERCFLVRGERRLLFQYATIGLLFVNVSIGGCMTPFAAPPVLMIARIWHWDFLHMLREFSWKALGACLVSSSLIGYIFRAELTSLRWSDENTPSATSSRSRVFHCVAMAALALSSHWPVVFVGILVIFILAYSHRRALGEVHWKQAGKIALFLVGVVVLGGLQSWWIAPLFQQMSAAVIYLGACLLTGFVDNAAITFIAGQVEVLSESQKYYLVAGSLVGGGLTVIANAPNPIGVSILEQFFEDGVSPLGLVLGALVPTVIALLFFCIH